MSLKKSIKRPLLHVAAKAGPHRWPSQTPRLWVLMYHRVLPADASEMQDAEPGMVVTPDTLAMHLRVLKQWAEPVHLNDWFERHDAGKPLPSRAVAVTFDDGWIDNYQHAFPVLQQHAFPATIFLVSDWIDTLQMFWPERIARILRLGILQSPETFQSADTQWLTSANTGYDFRQAPTREQLSELFAHCKQWSDIDLHEKLDALSESLALPPPENRTLMQWQQVHAMQDSGLVRFGSHTCRHVRLTDTLDTTLMSHEIVASQRRLEEALGRKVDLFCYPNGNHTAAAVEEVKKHYRAAVTTQRGYNNVHTDSHLLFRVGVHNDVSADPVSFMARLSCWF